MAYDWIPAKILNDTEDLWLVVKEDEGPFRWVPPGRDTSEKMWSVDAVAAQWFGAFQNIVYNGHVSPYWHIRDGTACGIEFDSSSGLGFLTLRVYRSIPRYGPVAMTSADFRALGYRRVVEPF